MPDLVQNPVEQLQQGLQQKAQEVTVSRGIRNYRALIFQGYLVVVVATFVVIAVLAHFIPYFPIDLAVTKMIQRYNPPWFDFLMKFVSAIGMPPQVILIVLTLAWLLFLAGLKWEAVASLFTAGMTSLVNGVLKTVVNRQRPSVDLVTVFQHLKDRSFPSGHVMLYTAFFGFLLFLAYTLIAKSRRRTILMTILSLLILLVGPSRIYEGEHWASDVFGAYMMGSVMLALMIYIYRWGKPKFFVHQPTASPKKI